MTDDGRPTTGAEIDGGQKTEDQSAVSGPRSALTDLDEAHLAELNNLAEQLRRAQSMPREKRAWIAQKLCMSAKTFERKLKAFKEQGIVALARKPRADRGASRIADKQIIARIKAEYLTPYRLKITHVYKKIAKDYALSALTPPSYSVVRRVCRSIDPDLLARLRFGEREFDDKFAYISLRKKPPLPRQWVDADHHPCDHYVVFPDGQIGRPWLTAAQDICTNEILGYEITKEKPVGQGTYPGSISIGLCLRQSIMRKEDVSWPSFGIFDHLYVDLGKDFRSQHVRAVCADLGIEIVRTRGYHGKSKPIERWFGIMEDQLRSLPGYCGSKPEDNPERQKLKPEALDPRKLLTIEQYERALHGWIVNEFHHAESRALDGLSPLDALQAHIQHGFIARELRDERVLDLVLMRRKNKLVRNAGVQHFNRFFMAPELLPLIGQHVDVCWDPTRAGAMVVYKDNRFVCKAANRELLDFGATEETLARERELKRQQKRNIEERYQDLIKQSQYPDPLARAAAEERSQKLEVEERKAIAVNAEAPSAAVLLPKHQRAVKLLNTRRSNAGDRTIIGPRSLVAPKALPVPGREQTETNPWLEEPARPESHDLFHRETNPWLEEDD